MTKLIEGVHVRTYEEWIKIPEVKILEDEIEECETCEGTGEHVCSCGNEHDCEDCGGIGKSSSLKDMYQEELKKELYKLLIWREKVLGKLE